MQASHKISTVYEHPTITRLFEELVLNRNYVASEEILQKMYEQDLLKGYNGLVPKRYSWKTLHDSSMQLPPIRGGHATCAHDGTVWLFGGSECNDVIVWLVPLMIELEHRRWKGTSQRLLERVSGCRVAFLD